MNRRKFLQILGIGAAAPIIAKIPTLEAKEESIVFNTLGEIDKNPVTFVYDTSNNIRVNLVGAYNELPLGSDISWFVRDKITGHIIDKGKISNVYADKYFEFSVSEPKSVSIAVFSECTQYQHLNAFVGKDNNKFILAGIKDERYIV